MLQTEINKTAKFKLLCTYCQKSDGTLYTQLEKDQNKNISFLYSNEDLDAGKSLYIIRHDREFAKMVGYVDKNWEFIDSCTLFMNDLENNEEIKIGVWCKANYLENDLCNLVFEKQGANVVCLGIEQKAKRRV